MNLKKLLIGVAVVAVLIGGWKFLTRTDRSSPIAVGNAFTKALKAGNTSKASGYWLPDGAEAWRTSTDETVGALKSGATSRYYEGIPDQPGFAATPGKASGTMVLQSENKVMTLNLSQIDGKWYVSKSSL